MLKMGRVPLLHLVATAAGEWCQAPLICSSSSPESSRTAIVLCDRRLPLGNMDVKNRLHVQEMQPTPLRRAEQAGY